MKLLITGANGMLATNIIEVLLEKGWTVRGLLRQRASYRGLMHSSLELVEGDFTDFDTVSAAMRDCDAIIHSAAIIAQNLLRYEDYVRVNVEATQQLMTLARIHHIKKFVYVSSANTIGCGTADSPSTEVTPLTSPLSSSLYGRSKAAGEELVIEMGGIVVNPTFMIGRYGSSNGSNRIFKMARQITFCPPGGKNFIDVEDAARGIVGALEWGHDGEKYLIAGQNLSFRDFFKLFPQVRYVVTIPRWVILSAGVCGSVVRMLGFKAALSFTNARILCLPFAYDNSKARQVLSFHPQSIDVSLNGWRSKKIIK